LKRSFLICILPLFLLSGTFLWAQNILQNPGFEDWTGDSAHYWDSETSGYDLYRESGTVHSGTFSAKLVLKSTSTQRFTQYVSSISSGNDYEFYFWCFDNDQQGRARIVIRWYNAGGGFISGYYGAYSSDSTAWQQLNSGPQLAPPSAESAHVEVRLYDVGASFDSATIYVDDASLQDLGSGTPPETLSIYDIQGQATSSPYVNSAVVTYGIVTGVFGNDFFIEEQPGSAWHGIYVFGGSSAPNRSDSVQVTGIVTEHFGMTEITGPIVDVLSVGASIPGPTVLQTGSISVEEYESVLVRIFDAICTNDSLGSGQWEVDDGSGPLIIDDMDVAYVPDSGQTYTITGPIMYSVGEFKMEPRDSSDIVPGSGVSNKGEVVNHPNWTIFPTISSNMIYINLTINRAAKTDISVFDITGRKIAALLTKTLDHGSHIIAWNGNTVSAGVYFIKVNIDERTESGKVILLN